MVIVLIGSSNLSEICVFFFVFFYLNTVRDTCKREGKEYSSNNSSENREGKRMKDRK